MRNKKRKKKKELAQRYAVGREREKKEREDDRSEGKCSVCGRVAELGCGSIHHQTGHYKSVSVPRGRRRS